MGSVASAAVTRNVSVPSVHFFSLLRFALFAIDFAKAIDREKHQDLVRAKLAFLQYQSPSTRLL